MTHVTDPRFHVGPMDALYHLVLGMVETRFDAETRERFARWLHSVKPTVAPLAVMLVEMALSGTPMGEGMSECYLVLTGFTADGEPLINLLQQRSSPDRPRCSRHRT